MYEGSCSYTKFFNVIEKPFFKTPTGIATISVSIIVVLVVISVTKIKSVRHKFVGKKAK
jgi:hypothetical protein